MFLTGTDGRALKLQGLALPYDTFITFEGGPECFAPGCFSHQTARNFVGDNIDARRDHVEQTHIANTANGTVALFDTDHGLLFDIMLPATDAGRGYAALARLGTLGASIGPKWLTKGRDGTVLRAHLDHVGLTQSPAYPTLGLCWLSDMAAHQIPREARQWRAKLNLASMRDRCAGKAGDDTAWHNARPARSRNAARPSLADSSSFKSATGTARRNLMAALNEGLSQAERRQLAQEWDALDRETAESLGLTVLEYRKHRHRERAAARHMVERERMHRRTR